jgi:hypothetical protein
MFFSCVYCVCFVGSGPATGLITSSEESCGLCLCLIVCDLDTLTTRRPSPELCY